MVALWGVLVISGVAVATSNIIELSPDFCISDVTEVLKSLIFGGFHDRSRRALVAGSDASVEISPRKET